MDAGRNSLNRLSFGIALFIVLTMVIPAPSTMFASLIQPITQDSKLPSNLKSTSDSKSPSIQQSLLSLQNAAATLTPLTGTFTAINDPNAAYPQGTGALGINNAGQIVGVYYNTLAGCGTAGFGYLYSINFTSINMPTSSGDGCGTRLNDINDGGEVVSDVTNTGFGTASGFYSSSPYSAFTAVNDPNGAASDAIGVNNAGTIVGFYETGGGAQWGYQLSGGTYSDVIYPSSTGSFAQGINNNGVIVGAYNDGSGKEHGFIDSSGNYTSFDPPGSTRTIANGINDQNEIVGQYQDSSNNWHGFLYSTASQTYYSIDYPSATATYASRINNADQIVGSYSDSSGKTHGFLLTPLPKDIYAIGGLANSGVTNEVDAYNPGTNTWSTVASLSTARHSLAAAADSGKIYAIGGVTNSGDTNVVESYNPGTNTWSTVAPMPTARDQFATAVDLSGNIYAIGGTNGTYLNTVEKYNPGTNAWSTVAPMPAPSECLGAATDSSGNIYAIGGESSNVGLNTVYMYNPGTNTWSTVAPIPTAGCPGGVATDASGNIYAMGGFTVPGAVYESTVEKYNPGTNTWSSVASLPASDAFFAAATDSSGNIYAVGGATPTHSTVYMYNPVTNTWSTVASLPTARANLAAVAAPPPPDATSTVVTPNPATVTSAGQVTFTATVSDTTTPTNTPGGIVTFIDGGAHGTFGAVTCNPSGNDLICTSTYTAPSTSQSITITGTYGGDATHNTSVGTASLAVKDATSTVVTPNPASVTVGGQIVFTATVSDTSNPSNIPGPTVTFSDGSAGGAFGAVRCSPPVNNLVCTSTYTAPSAPVPVTITANFAANVAQLASSGNSSLTVSAVAVPPTVTISSPTSGGTVSTSTVPVIGTATVGSYPLTSVQVSVDGGAFAPVLGTTNWSLTTGTLSNGIHSVLARALDNNGNVGISSGTDGVIGSPITLPSGASDTAFDSANGYLYAASQSGNSVIVIDTSTNTLATGFPNPIAISGPTSIVYDSANHNIYVSASGGTYVINGATNTIMTGPGLPISVFGFIAMAFDSKNGDIYGTNGGLVYVINGATNTVVGSPITLPSGGGFNIAFDSANGDLYIPNQSGNSVSVINGTTNALATGFTNPIPVGSLPFNIAFDSANGHLYVTNQASNSVSVINGATNTVLTGPGLPIPETAPQDIAFDSANGHLYVSTGSSISVIDGATNTPVSVPTISVTAPPFNGMTFAPSNGNLYVTSGGNSITRISTPTTFTVNVASFPSTSSVSSSDGAGNVTFSTSSGGFNTLSALSQSDTGTSGLPSHSALPYGAFAFNIVGVTPGSTVTVNMTFPAQLAPNAQYWKDQSGTWVNATSHVTIVNNRHSMLLSITDGGFGDSDASANGIISDPGAIVASPNQPITTLNTGTAPIDAVFDPVTHTVYVSNNYNGVGNGTVSIINDTSNTFSSITLGKSTQNMAVNPNTNRIYVANNQDNTVSVIDGATNTVMATIGVGNGPTTVAVNPSTNTIYATNENDNTVSVISGATNAISTTIPVGSDPVHVVVNPSTNEIYVTNQNSNNVYVINGTSNTVIGSPISVGTHPGATAFDPANGYVYVASQSNNSVYAINGATNTVIGSPILVGLTPEGIAYDPVSNTIYVANYASNTVSIINPITDTVIATIPVGSGPQGIGIDTFTNTVYVANTAGNSVSVINGGVPATLSTPPGLVGWWMADGNTNDFTGTYNGVAHGGLTYVRGVNGSAFGLNGVDSYVSIPSQVYSLSGGTVSVWTKISTCTSGPNPIIGSYNGGNGRAPDIDTAHCSVLWNFGPNGGVPTNFTLNTNEWYNMALTYDSAYNVKFYINGVQVGPTVLTGNPGSFANEVDIGHYFNFGSFFYNGDIDNVQIYNRPLSSSEIFSIYSSQSPPEVIVTSPTNGHVFTTPTPTISGTASSLSSTISSVKVSTDSGSTYSDANIGAGLVGYLPGEGDAAAVGGANQGILNGVTFTQGEIGQAFSFNGSGTNVEIPYSPSINVGLGSGFTFDAWISPTDVATGGPIMEYNNGAGSAFTQLWFGNGGSGFPAGSLWANIIDTTGRFHLIVSPGGVLQNNVPQHIAITYDKSTGIANLYVNGGVVATQSFVPFTPRTDTNLFLGARVSGGPSGAFSGWMDEIHLFNRALSPSEIGSMQVSGFAGNEVTNTWSFTTPPLSNGAYNIVANATSANLQSSITGITPFTVNVVSFPSTSSVSSSTGAGTVNFKTSSGGFANLSALVNTTTTFLPISGTLPFGVFTFNVTGLAHGSTDQVNMTFPTQLASDAQYWKLLGNGTWYNATSHVIITNNRFSMLLNVTDGGFGDSDGIANSNIVDPGAVVVPSISNSTADFTVQAPTSLSAARSGSASGNVMISSLNGFNGTVNLAVSGLPSGVGASFAPSLELSSGGTNSTLLTLNVGPSVSLGNYTVLVNGTSGATFHTSSIDLVVVPPDFTISALNPVSATQGTSGSTTIQVGSLAGFSGSVMVSLNATTIPTGVSITASQDPLEISSGGSNSTALFVNVGPSVPPGTYTIEADGSSGAISHSTTFTLTVNPSSPPGDFAVTGSPAVIVQGNSGPSTVTVTSTAPFNSPVILSLSNLPSGINGTFDTDVLTPSSGGSVSATVTLSVNSIVPAGTYNIDVLGLSGTVSHTGEIVLTVGQATASGGVNNVGPAQPVLLSDNAFTQNSAGSITVSSNAGTPTIQAFVSSSSDPSGILVTLTQISPGSTTYASTNQVTFTSGDTGSPSNLEVNSGDTITVTYPPSGGDQFIFRDPSSGGVLQPVIGWGQAGDIPLLANLTGNTDTVGIYRPSTSQFIFRDPSSGGVLQPVIGWGQAGDIPVVAHLTGNTDTVGIYRPSTSQFIFRDPSSGGVLQPVIGWGQAGDVPMTGELVGSLDTVGIYRPVSGGTTTTATVITNKIPVAGAAVSYTNNLNCVGDSSHDGICDEWKYSQAANGLPAGVNIPINGINYNFACTPGTTYASDPLGDQVCPVIGTKDVYVEIDYMVGQQPDINALAQVVNAFLAHNIQLHLLVDENMGLHYGNIPLTTTLNSDGSVNQLGYFGASGSQGYQQGLKDMFFGTAAERANAHANDLLTAKRQFYHYAMYVHNLTTPGGVTGQSGYGEIGGNDMIISLGSFTNGVGSTAEQAATFMHELGHNLGLDHGGPITLQSTGALVTDHSLNCKPNYPSVMNYLYQMPYLVSGRPLDYSEALTTSTGATATTMTNTLNESTLSESPGIGESGLAQGWQAVIGGVDGNGNYQQSIVPFTGSVDFDQDNTAASSLSYSKNIHEFNIPNCDTGTNSKLTTLTSYDDWDNLNLEFRNSQLFQNGFFTINAADPSGSDVKNIQSLAVSSLADKIGSLPDSAFAPNYAPDMKTIFDGELVKVSNSIQAGNLVGTGSASDQLQNIVLPQMTGSGTASTNVLITDPTAQKQVSTTVNNIINALVAEGTPSPTDNLAPGAQNEVLTTNENVPLGIQLNAALPDPSNESPLLANITNTLHGTLAPTPIGTNLSFSGFSSMTYAPTTNYVGQDQLTYQVKTTDNLGVTHTSNLATVTINVRGTTTMNLSLPTTSVVIGTPTTITATVTGSSPSGVVSFNSPGTFSPTNSCQLSGGQCSVLFTPASTGHLPVNATYTGDIFNQISFASGSMNVTKHLTTTNVQLSSVTIGSPTTVTATVAGFNPSGNVNFTGDGTFSPTNSCALQNGGSCSVSFTPSSSGTTSISASYLGDANNKASSSPNNSLTVNQQASSISVNPATSPVVVGSPTTVLVTVSGFDPTGSVTLSSNSTGQFNSTSCTLSNGKCAVTYTPSVVGNGYHKITAIYGGDLDNVGSSGSGIVAVTQTQPTMTVTPNPTSIQVGQSSSVVVNIIGVSPSGNVTFSAPSIFGQFNSTQCTLHSGTCGVTFNALGSIGTVNINATYPGDQNNQPSKGSNVLTVAKAITSTQPQLAPSTITIGGSTTIKATVTGFLPSGNVDFTSNGVGQFNSTSCTLSNGKCAVTYTPSSVGTGPHTINATYQGDGENLVSGGLSSLTVNQQASSISVNPATSPVVVGSPTTVLVTVSGFDPTGSVTLSSNSTGQFNSTSCTLSNGKCAVTYTPSVVGNGYHKITAIYGGDLDNVGSSGSGIVAVTQTQSAESISFNPSPVVVGQASTVTVTINGVSSTGSVTLSSNSTGQFNSTSCTLSNGKCAVTYTPSVVGNGYHKITAIYGGDTNNLATTYAKSLSVLQATSTTTVSLSPAFVPAGGTTNVTVTITGFSLSGTVSFSAPSGTFSSSICQPKNGICSVLYTASLTGEMTISANYGQDTNNKPSSGSAVLTVATLENQKSGIASNIKSLESGIIDKNTTQKLDRAAMHVQKSAENSLWNTDGNTLNLKKGKQVFDEEADSVNLMLRIIQRPTSEDTDLADQDDTDTHDQDLGSLKTNPISPSLSSALQTIINQLETIDSTLAQNQINAASSLLTTLQTHHASASIIQGMQQDISNANSLMQKASSDLTTGNFHRAIFDYRQAWSFATQAINLGS